MEIVDQGILSRRTGRGAYMPVITPLADGTWIAAQHVGESLGGPDCTIEVLRSADGGRTWTNEGAIHRPANGDGWSYRGPAIHEVLDGRLVMTATRFDARTQTELFDPDSQALQPAEMLLFWSEDLGRSWSPPQVVSVDLDPKRYTANGAGVLLQLSPSRWMYPLETWKPPHWDGPPDQKAAAVFSADGGQTWGEFTVVADDPSGQVLWWDQMGAMLRDGRIYTLLWSHRNGTSDDLNNHWVVSEDEGRSWSTPRETNLRGQVCTPIPLADGRVAAVYNFRHLPEGIRLAVSDNLTHYDTDGELVVFGAGAEATLGTPQAENFVAEHLQIGFGKPGGVLLEDGEILVYYWCTLGGITDTRWARVRVD